MNDSHPYRQPALGPDCPKCAHRMIRINRTTKDRIIYYISLSTLRCKRFICEQCGTELTVSSAQAAELAGG